MISKQFLEMKTEGVFLYHFFGCKYACKYLEHLAHLVPSSLATLGDQGSSLCTNKNSELGWGGGGLLCVVDIVIR